MSADEQDKAFRQRERRRTYLESAGTITMALGLGAGFVTLGLNGSDTSLFAALAVAGLGAVLILMAWTPKADRQRRAMTDTKRDRLQRARRRTLVSLPIGGLGVMIWSLGSVSRLAKGGLDAVDFILAVAILGLVWLTPLIVLGWDGQGRQQRKWLDDELTRQWRGQALSLGFWTLIGGLSAAYLTGLYRPDWGVMGLVIAAWVASTTTGLSYAWLDVRADRDDG